MRWIRLGVAVLAAVYLFLITFPELPAPIVQGVDPAWVFGINEAKAQGLSFGSQIFYTYGPLGYLLSPQDIGSNLSKSLVFGTALAAATAVLGGWALLRCSSLWRSLIFLMGFAAALRIRPGSEERELLPILLALALTMEAQQPMHAVIAGATVLAAAGLLMKFSLGVSCAATLGAYLLLERLRRRVTTGHLAVYATGYACVVALLFVFSGNRAADLGSFLYYSVDLALHYSDAMSLPGPLVGVMLAVACAVFLVTYAATSAGPGVRLVTLMSLPVLFLTYKFGFVRYDPEHFFEPFATFIGCLSLLVLVTAARRDAVLLGVGMLLGLGSYSAMLLDRQADLPSLAMLSPAAGVERIRAYADWGELRSHLAEWSAAALSELELPTQLKAQLQTGTVDVVPMLATYVAANKLNWNPRMVFQSFAVMSPLIDHVNASHFTAENAPDFVLYGFHSIDARHPFFDEPAAVRALFCHYRIERAEPQLLVLRHTIPLCGKVIGGEHRTVSWDAEIPLPEDQAGLLVRLRFRYTWSGRVRRLLLRSPQVGIGLTYADGRTESYRLTPALARDGLWIGNLPRNLEEVRRLLAGQPLVSVRSFVLTSVPNWFEPAIEVEFARLPTHFTGADPRAATRPATESTASAENRTRM
jgi:hypothetical protein